MKPRDIHDWIQAWAADGCQDNAADDDDFESWRRNVHGHGTYAEFVVRAMKALRIELSRRWKAGQPLAPIYVEAFDGVPGMVGGWPRMRVPASYINRFRRYMAGERMLDL